MIDQDPEVGNLKKPQINPVTPGSLEGGASGNYRITIGDIVDNAWRAVSGFKAPFWGAMIILMVINLAIGLFQNIFVPGEAVINPQTGEMPSSSGAIFQILVWFITAPLNAGMIMMGVYWIGGREVSPRDLFKYFNLKHMFLLVGMQILMGIILLIGFLLLVLPGIYLAVAYSLTIPLMLDKNLSVWDAMETSRQAVTHHWFSFLGTFLMMILIYIISIIPLGIGLIWTLPMGACLIGLLYHTVFGISPEGQGSGQGEYQMGEE